MRGGQVAPSRGPEGGVAASSPPPGRPGSEACATDLVGLSRAELTHLLAGLGETERAAAMRARQLWHWIYHRGARAFDEMTSLPASLRARLAETCRIGRAMVVRELLSADGTRKWLLRYGDGEEVESVLIPEADRGALCLSTQVGCTLTCSFCHTGTQRLVRNLDAAEIVAQMLVARDALGEWPSPAGGRILSNLVVMGMGEPLYNYDSVARALAIAMDNEGIAISRRRITLSTAGVAPMIERVGRELAVNLAVSLHAVRDELRDELVPLNRKYPIAELLAACRRYPAGSNSRRITFEYVMLAGVNDSPADAKELCRLIRGIPAKVNLIPFNAWPGAPYQCAPVAAMERFAEIVNRAGYSAPLRTPRGRDIMAACGQLKSVSVRARRPRPPAARARSTP
ncbi:MAG: 23S rRNA (adenine(2503)-C(2))-methyltransferase RlmN [Alphaproteobacteria bacterium]|nr:23S rRNA (adenine(2503)-C(2))-methyltransferase RlmN [Alphaproteobacteria bacterium]